MRNKILIIIISLLSIISYGQVGLWQLDWAPDSTYVIGAMPSGEPIWKQITAGAAADTQYLEPLPSVGTPKNGFWLTDARDTVIFEVDQTVDYNNTNELQSIGLDSTITATEKTYRIRTTSPDDVPNVVQKIVVPLSSAGSSGTALVLGSNHVNTTTNPTTATVWTIALTANTTYKFQLIGLYQTAATTTGITAGLFYPTSTAAVGRWGVAVGINAATELSTRITTIDATNNANTNTISTTSVGGANTTYTIVAEMVIRPTVSQNLTFGFCSEVSGSAATLLAGSTLIYNTY